MFVHNLNALYPELAPKFSRNSEKLGKITRKTSVMKCTFNKFAGM